MLNDNVPRRSGAFTLLELLVVMVIMTILLSLIVPAFRQLIEASAPRIAAEEFLSAMRTARQYAMDNSVRTRVVFADDELVKSQNGRVKPFSYGVLTFFVPRQPTGASGFLPVRISGTITPIAVQMPWISIPSGFVGQWIPCPLTPKWRTISEKVKVESAMFDKATSPAFLETQHYFKIPNFWNQGGVDYYAKDLASSTFPKNYYQSPYPTAYPLITDSSPPEEDTTIVDPSTGRYLNYQQVWVENAKYTYFDTKAHTPNPRKVGQPETAATADRRFFDLPGIEYDSQGVPTFSWTPEISLVFTQKKNAYNTFEVTVDRTTGIPRLKK